MSSPWNILEKTAFAEVTGRANFGQVVFAVGWDDASVILKVVDNGGDEVSYNNSVQTLRLPKASHAYDHLWTTEWPRIREVETERFLLDMHGMFYELPPFAWGGSVFGIKPISQHLRMVPDYCSFRGFLVLGGNQVSSIFDNNLVTGQSQSGLFFGKTDDLWGFGKLGRPLALRPRRGQRAERPLPHDGLRQEDGAPARRERLGGRNHHYSDRGRLHGQRRPRWAPRLYCSVEPAQAGAADLCDSLRVLHLRAGLLGALGALRQ